MMQILINGTQKHYLLKEWSLHKPALNEKRPQAMRLLDLQEIGRRSYIMGRVLDLSTGGESNLGEKAWQNPPTEGGA